MTPDPPSSSYHLNQSSDAHKGSPSWDFDSIASWNETSERWDDLDTLSDAWDDPPIATKIPIDGRDDYEEVHWYDPAVRAIYPRPGKGILPPLLSDMLHDPNHALYSVSIRTQPARVSPPTPHTPTTDEVQTAIPHPNAYFCREHNGWILLVWGRSTVLPPLVKEPETPLPDQDRRMCTISCFDSDGEQPFGQANLTHHWHRYEKAVDATKLNPPYLHGELLLDLYLCCQCSMYCLVSDVIPGVIPLSLVDDFTLDKIGHPAIDKTPKATAVASWETILTKRVFGVLGFFLGDLNHGNGKAEELREVRALQAPPTIDPSIAEGKASRTKLLRAWVELSAWLVLYEKANKEALKDYYPMINYVHVKADSERDLYQTGIGPHVSQIARGSLPEHIISDAQLEPSWKALGMTPSTYSWEHFVFAYLAQCRCDPANTMVYFTHLVTIVNVLVNLHASVPDQLRSFIMQERERYRFTIDEHARYVQMLGFGRDNELGVELDSDVDDEFIAQAWRSAQQRAWMSAGDIALQRNALLNDALRVVAEQRGSAALIKVWTEEALDVPGDVDETMLQAAVCSMQIED